jgi:hypothetical protein
MNCSVATDGGILLPRVARQLAMLDERGQDDLLAALLEARDREGQRRRQLGPPIPAFMAGTPPIQSAACSLRFREALAGAG